MYECKAGKYQLEVIHLIPDRVDCIAWDELALPLGTVSGHSPDLNVNLRTGRVNALTYILTRHQPYGKRGRMSGRIFVKRIELVEEVVSCVPHDSWLEDIS